MSAQPETGQDAIVSALFDTAAAPPADIARNPDGTPAIKRFSVYRNNVIGSLKTGLSKTFPVVEALVGEEFFSAMAGEFISRMPPRSPVMSEYGSEFADFVIVAPADAHRRLDVLVVDRVEVRVRPLLEAV